MPDETRIGNFLLEDLLGEIRAAWEDKMPPVWGLVARANEPCREVLGAQGFGEVEAEGDYDLWFRKRGLAVDWRRG